MAAAGQHLAVRRQSRTSGDAVDRDAYKKQMLRSKEYIPNCAFICVTRCNPAVEAGVLRIRTAIAVDLECWTG